MRTSVSHRFRVWFALHTFAYQNGHLSHNVNEYATLWCAIVFFVITSDTWIYCVNEKYVPEHIAQTKLLRPHKFRVLKLNRFTCRCFCVCAFFAIFGRSFLSHTPALSTIVCVGFVFFFFLCGRSEHYLRLWLCDYEFPDNFDSLSATSAIGKTMSMHFCPAKWNYLVVYALQLHE